MKKRFILTTALIFSMITLFLLFAGCTPSSPRNDDTDDTTDATAPTDSTVAAEESTTVEETEAPEETTAVEETEAPEETTAVEETTQEETTSVETEDPAIVAKKNAQWEEIKALIAEFADENTWKTRSYEGAITQGMPLTALAGNGHVGVTSNGDAISKSYIISTTDFWKYVGEGFAGVPAPSVGGGLSIEAWDKDTGTAVEAADTFFFEEQDIVRAEIRTNLYLGNAKVKMVNWLSADKDIMITAITSESDAAQTLHVNLYGSDLNTQLMPIAAGKGTFDNGQEYVWASRRSSPRRADHPWLNEFAMASTVIGANEAEYSSTSKSGDGDIVFELPANGTVYVVTAIGCEAMQPISSVTGAKGNAVAKVSELLGTVQTTEDIEVLHESHLDWWKEFYLLSWVDLGDKDLNRLYYGNQYLFGCSTREGVQAPGIFSVWITTDNPLWQGDYHLNYNMEAPYYGSYSSNRMSEFSEPMFQLFLDYIDYGIENASVPEKLKLCTTDWYWSTRIDEEAFINGFEDSILLPVNLVPYTDPDKLILRHYLNQTMNALFCAEAIVTYYNYSQDYEWLTTKRETATGSMHSPYDFVAKVANFYTYWVEKRAPRIDDEYIKDAGPIFEWLPSDYTANYHKYPEYDESVHGDNYVYVLFDGSHESTYEFNPGVITGGIHYITDMLKALGSDAAIKCGYTEERFSAWKDLSEHLVTPEVCIFEAKNYGKLTIFGLGEDRELFTNAATVNLEWIHPAYQLGFNGDPYILEVARNTVTVMGDMVNPGYACANNTPKIFTHAARVGYDTDKLIKRMKTFCVNKMAANNYISDGQHGWEKAGVIEALNTMMVMSDGGIIKLFPTWNGTDAKFNTIRMPGAFLVSSELKDGKVQFVEVTSEKGGELKLVIPFEGELELIDLTTGDAVNYATAVTENSKDNYLIVSTEASHTYSLQLKK